MCCRSCAAATAAATQQVYVRVMAVIMARVLQEGFASPPGASPAKAWRDAERRTCAPRYFFALRNALRNFAEPKYLCTCNCAEGNLQTW